MWVSGIVFLRRQSSTTHHRNSCQSVLEKEVIEIERIAAQHTIQYKKSHLSMNLRSRKRITAVLQLGLGVIANLLNVIDVVHFQFLQVAAEDMSTQYIFELGLLSRRFSASKLMVCWIINPLYGEAHYIAMNRLRVLVRTLSIRISRPPILKRLTSASSNKYSWSGLIVLVRQRFASQLNFLMLCQNQSRPTVCDLGNSKSMLDCFARF